MLSCSLWAQDFSLVRGYVYDENNIPLPGVEIRVTNTSLGTITNEDGQYELRLEHGLNRITFSFIGYETIQRDIVVEKDMVQNIWLKPDENTFQTVEITRKKKDISNWVIKQVIEHRDSIQNLYHSHKCQVYIKSVEVEEYQGKEKKDDDDIPGEADFDRFEKDENPQPSDSGKVPNMNLYECQLIRHYQKPSDIKEQRLAVKKYGDQSSLFYKSTTEGEFDLYQNLIHVRSLGQNALVSPFSTGAFLAYKFKLRMIYHDETGKKIYVIGVVPRKLGNALFKGEVEIESGSWTLRSVDLEVPKTALVLYDEFRFHQDFAEIDGRHMMSGQSFNWKFKNGKSNTEGYCKVQYKQHVLDTVYSPKFFNAELRVTEKEAYEKDTSFWMNIRPEPLSVSEQRFVRYRDSLHHLYTSKEFLDSIDSLYNRVTFLKLAWNGQGYINRQRKENIEFSPLISVLDPVAIGGWRVRYDFSYYRKFVNRKSIYIAPFFNYGFKNKDVKGSLYVEYLFNPLKRSEVSLSVGRYFDFVNPYAPILNIIRRDNFFEKNYISADLRTELVNGLYIGTFVNFEQRNSLNDFQFAALGDTLFEDNNPIDFDEHNALRTSVYLSYTPHQLYLKEPYEKIILGSRYPTFTLSVQKAWNNILNSKIKFSYGEFAISQKFNVGIFGTSQYRFNMGQFFDTTSLRVMDYRYQRAGDPVFFTPPMYTYQLLDSTFPTFRLFFEGHYVHQFNGFLMNRIPLLKKTNIKASAGAGFLYAPERNYQYTELFVGLNRILKIGKERLRLGTYYTVAQSNHFGFRSMFKVSFEFYNRTKNTWTF